MRRIAALVAFLAGPAAADVVPDPHMEAALVADRAGVVPGQSVRVALRLKSDAGWHTYWRNPGDAGSPTEISWTLPEGTSAGPIEWPPPQVIKEGDFVIFGYDGEVLLPSTLMVPASAKPGEMLPLKALAYWVICREICIPGDAELSLAVPVVAAPVAPESWPSAPVARSDWSARLTADSRQIVLVIETTGETLANPVFLPHAPGLVPPDAAQSAEVEGKRLTLRLARAPELRQELQRIDGLLLATKIVDGRHEPLAVVVEATR